MVSEQPSGPQFLTASAYPFGRPFQRPEISGMAATAGDGMAALAREAAPPMLNRAIDKPKPQAAAINSAMETLLPNRLDPRNAASGSAWPRIAWWVAEALMVLVIACVGVVAIGSGTGVILLPFEMHLLNERLNLSAPGLFQTHMVASAAALLLLPPVIWLRHRPRIHRVIGRVLGGFVVVGGLTALPVAIFSHSIAMARAGFFVQGLVWLGLFTAGFMAIRRRDRATHARFMIAMAAVSTGAIWFRILTGTAIWLQLPFEPIYGAAAWLGWIVPLAIVTCWPGVVPALRV